MFPLLLKLLCLRVVVRVHVEVALDDVLLGPSPYSSGRVRFPDELHAARSHGYRMGTLAMANAGPDTNGSQFFICIDDCTRKLQKAYNLFGYVVDGIDVAQETQVGDVMHSVRIEETPRD
jgi:cyclophilin family peptidyl-prolyl cis-trans isomerase